MSDSLSPIEREVYQAANTKRYSSFLDFMNSTVKPIGGYKPVEKVQPRNATARDFTKPYKIWIRE